MPERPPSTFSEAYITFIARMTMTVAKWREGNSAQCCYRITANADRRRARAPPVLREQILAHMSGRFPKDDRRVMIVRDGLSILYQRAGHEDKLNSLSRHP